MELKDSAAHDLLGITLNNNWEVIEKVKKDPNDSGGFFSVCYLVDNGSFKGFLKAINVVAFFQLFKGKTTMQILAEQAKAYEYEKNLLEKCKDRSLSKVSILLDAGETSIDGHTLPVVPYLIFELAEGNVRSHKSFSQNLDIAWKLNSLHNVAVGIKQLHQSSIAHQDIKPSNILLYKESSTSKIGDLGRSLTNLDIPPHDLDGSFAGDMIYSPPEFLYGYINPNWDKKVKSADLFLFGSLVCNYFTGVNLTALISKHLPNKFRWGIWGDGFEEVKPYLIDSFYKALVEFRSTFKKKDLGKELSSLIEYCAHPDPLKRGNIEKFPTLTNIGDFEKIISRLTLLSKKVEYNIL